PPPPHRPMHSFPTRRSSDLFRLALALQAAKDERSSILLGEALHLLIQDCLELAQGRLGNGLFGRAAFHLSFALPSPGRGLLGIQDRKSTRLNSSHQIISYAV